MRGLSIEQTMGRRWGRVAAARLAAVVLAAAVCLLAVPSLASAGEYHVYSCRTPAGSPAPIEGWTGSVGGAWDYDGNSCPGGGALYAAEGANFSHLANTDLTTWAFNAPSGESIAKATLWRAGDTAGGTASNATYVFWLAAPNYTYDSANVFDACPNNSCPGQGEPGNPLSGVNRVELAPSNLGSHIYMTASCGGVTNWQCPGGPGDASGFAVVVYVYEANIVLKQDSQPSASGVGGELASAATVSGTSDLTFSAADAGGDLPGGLQRGRPCGAEPPPQRKRRSLSQRGADHGRAGGIPLPSALPAVAERRHSLQHDRFEQRPAPSHSERDRCRE